MIQKRTCAREEGWDERGREMLINHQMMDDRWERITSITMAMVTLNVWKILQVHMQKAKWEGSAWAGWEVVPSTQLGPQLHS